VRLTGVFPPAPAARARSTPVHRRSHEVAVVHLANFVTFSCPDMSEMSMRKVRQVRARNPSDPREAALMRPGMPSAGLPPPLTKWHSAIATQIIPHLRKDLAGVVGCGRAVSARLWSRVVRTGQSWRADGRRGPASGVPEPVDPGQPSSPRACASRRGCSHRSHSGNKCSRTWDAQIRQLAPPNR
jgi:hypothetical protein